MAGQADRWISTPELCAELAISRTTLYRWRQRGVLRQGLHWVRKNPGAPRSDHLWSPTACRVALNGPQA
jgi:predicted DNA-binding transcriptional regulator AlpA